MLSFVIRIEGTSPLLMNRFTDEAQMAATSGSRTSMAAIDRGSPEEQADKVLYKGLNGQVIIPQPNIMGSFREAGKYFKVGRNKVTTQKNSLIPACVFIYEEYVDLEYQDEWTVDSRPVRIPASGGRILRHRPKFNDWAFNVQLDLDDTDINPKLLREIVDTAGRKVGLCDYRPSTSGPFGRYVVSHWEAVDPDDC